MPPFTRKPNRLPHKPNRLPHKPIYQGNNWYFVTICTADRECLFVEEPLRFQNGTFDLNHIGLEVAKLWYELPSMFSNIILDEFVIMPNHIHFVIGIQGDVYYKNSERIQSLSDLVGKFKSLAWTRVKNDQTIDTLNDTWSDNWNRKGSSTGIWQKSFYDHVIRDEKDLKRVREYICNNPANWELDEMNPKHGDREVSSTQLEMNKDSSPKENKV
jgi:putative transposase